MSYAIAAMVLCEMTPPVSESIHQAVPNEWIFGLSMVCEKVISVPPCNTLVSWRDGEDKFFCLRPKGEQTTQMQTTRPAPNMIHHSGTSGAVWVIGNALCKVKAWVEGMETEADTLRYVRAHFDVPVPEIIYDWVDKEASRSFLILRRVDGETLQQAWPALSDHQRTGIAAQVAFYCEILAKETSHSLGSVTGRGIPDRYLIPRRPESIPSWQPIPFRRLTMPEAKIYLSPLDTGDNFHFYHADLSPTNIMVSEDGRVTCILDWESAAFYPHVWIGTKPTVGYGFILEGVDGDKWAWSKLLANALEKSKFESDAKGFSAFHKKR